MTTLSTAEAALRRAPDDPAVPVTVSGAEAVAVIAELDRLRERGDALAEAGQNMSVVSSLVGEPWRRLQRGVDAWKNAR